MTETDPTVATEPTEPTEPPSDAELAQASRAPVLVNGGTHVLMYNPETDGTWESPLDYTDQALADGWVFAPDPSEAEVGTEVAEQLAAYAADSLPPTDVVGTSFDPAKANVDAVNAYIETQMAEGRPGEAARVVELEQANKNRSSILDPFAPTPTS